MFEIWVLFEWCVRVTCSIIPNRLNLLFMNGCAFQSLRHMQKNLRNPHLEKPKSSASPLSTVLIIRIKYIISKSFQLIENIVLYSYTSILASDHLKPQSQKPEQLKNTISFQYPHSTSTSRRWCNKYMINGIKIQKKNCCEQLPAPSSSSSIEPKEFVDSSINC